MVDFNRTLNHSRQALLVHTSIFGVTSALFLKNSHYLVLLIWELALSFPSSQKIFVTQHLPLLLFSLKENRASYTRLARCMLLMLHFDDLQTSLHFPSVISPEHNHSADSPPAGVMSQWNHALFWIFSKWAVGVPFLGLWMKRIQSPGVWNLLYTRHAAVSQIWL